MIRLAESKDIAEINALGNLLYSNFENKYDIKSYLENNKYFILVNIHDIIDTVLIIYKNIDYYEIETIVTNISSRNLGYATETLEYFLNNYCQKGDTILLEVSSTNTSAIRLYTKFGFKSEGIRKNYYGNSDAILMKKVI